MPDREKVIKVIEGLEHCIVDNNEPCNCPYDGDGGCIGSLMRDALALLKAQEANNDWISRKRLKNEIQYYIDEAGWGEEINRALGWCLEFIDNQEAVKWE